MANEQGGCQGNQTIAVLMGGPGDGKEINRETDGSWPVFLTVQQKDQDYIYMVRVVQGGRVIYIPSHVYPSKNSDKIFKKEEDQ